MSNVHNYIFVCHFFSRPIQHPANVVFLFLLHQMCCEVNVNFSLKRVDHKHFWFYYSFLRCDAAAAPSQSGKHLAV